MSDANLEARGLPRCLYSPNCRQGVYSETQVPVFEMPENSVVAQARFEAMSGYPRYTWMLAS
jgi:hypothetical protein